MIVNFSQLFKVESLQTKVDNKTNIFSFIRVFASFLVLYSHAYHIYGSGADPLTNLSGYYTGSFAVLVFFSISGFFIVNSAMNRTTFQFVAARVGRIFPALIVANLITILVILPISTNYSLSGLLDISETFTYLQTNSLLNSVQFIIPGVFDSHPDKAINGSLWTLPLELRAYILTFFIVAFGFTKNRLRFNCFVIVTILFYLNFNDFFISAFPVPGSHKLFAVFLFGSALYLNRDYVFVSPLLSLISFILLLFFREHFSDIVLLFLIVYFVISTAYTLSVFFKDNISNDYSYGLYLYAYPCSQLAYALCLDYGFFEYFIVLTLITFIFSYLSWHLVEKRLMQYIKAKMQKSA
jgi:peptidoglycan/LPS O-acetylase OafA/YrhL